MTRAHHTPWSERGQHRLHALFTRAHIHVPNHIRNNLQPWRANLTRALDLSSALAVELNAALARADAHFKKVSIPRPLLSSFEAQRDELASGYFNPNDLERFFQRELQHLEAAIAARTTPEHARDRIRRAQKAFQPTLRKALNQLRSGPFVIRALTGPMAYSIAPSLWIGSAVLLGEKRREHRIQIEAHQPTITALSIRRACAAIAFSVAAAAVGPFAIFNAMNISDIYTEFLNDLEHFLLYGVHANDDPDEENDEDALWGWLELIDVLEDDHPSLPELPKQDPQTTNTSPTLPMGALAVDQPRGAEPLPQPDELPVQSPQVLPPE